MLTNNAALKYEAPYKWTPQITQCWTNGTATLQYDAIKIRYIICRMSPYTSDTNIEDIIIENCCLTTSIRNYQLYNSVIYIKYCNKVNNQMQMGTLK